MRKLILFTVIALFGVAPLLALWSYYLADENGRNTFWSNVLLNLVAEFLGFTLGILLPLIIAAWFAEDKIKPIVQLIARLRSEKIITPLTARGCVMCAAKLISEEKLKKDSSLSLLSKPDSCAVCSLTIDTRSDNRCQHCGLKDHVWKIEVESAEV